MTPKPLRWLWLVLLVAVAAGVVRLRFNADPLDLLPENVPAVAGLKLYQEHFANARELIITVQGPGAAETEGAARAIAGRLAARTNLVLTVDWQPPWLEHPEQTAELIAYLWLNQPPGALRQLASRLAPTNLDNVLSATRERLATTMSPQDIAQLSYDPLGFTQLPLNPMARDWASGNQIFSSSDGKFRILFVQSRGDLPGYKECSEWLAAVKQTGAGADTAGCKIGYTGRPAFVAEISAGMKHDIVSSVVGTSVIIGILFWLAHRRVKPMLWLLALLGLILAATLALGGLIFGEISVISMGFAAILLGLAVDYAVVHYQEALAQPELSIPQIRRVIAPSIFWAALTTISAFLALNLGGLPGLAQLGSLVAIGVALAAFVMIFAYLPPLFPERMQPYEIPPSSPSGPGPAPATSVVPGAPRIFCLTGAVLALAVAILAVNGLPRLDGTTRAFEPRGSPAYAAMEGVKNHIGGSREPVWMLFAGPDESAVARKLDAVELLLAQAVSNGVLSGYNSPAILWPRPGDQAANRETVRQLIAERAQFRSAVENNGFSADALGTMERVLDGWQQASARPGVFWPSNSLSDWIFEKVAARGSNELFAAAFLYPSGSVAQLASLQSQLPSEGVWLSSWEMLGQTVLDSVKHNLWKLLCPIAALILLSLWLAFRRALEPLLSLAILFLSGLCLLALMSAAGWSWNVLNLMALPIILGTGVDYSIFLQLALRRHHGDLREARRSVGRALLLCGGTAVAGFGSLGLSSNAGMAGLGRVCAAGVAGNVLLSVFCLPRWWKLFAGGPQAIDAPSRIYQGWSWRIGLAIGKRVPPRISTAVARFCASVYWRLSARRREIVIQNLLPVAGNDRAAAERGARELFAQFGVKLADLWRYESGAQRGNWFTEWLGWEHFAAANARGKGVLLVTVHLGNWELGGPYLAGRGYRLLVLTQPEPNKHLTQIRQASRAGCGVETVVIGENDFAIVEIIKALKANATVALLIDRPPPPTGVMVELFGRPFAASIAPAELARATGCAILPTVLVRRQDGYAGQILQEVTYDRAAIGDRVGRIRLTQEITRVFEPHIRQNLTQWFHFVPIWPSEASDS